MTQEQRSDKVPDTEAVAVKDVERGGGAAPKITATGKGYLAEKILDIAFESGVRVRQDHELTAILRELEVESPVPLEALECVADILRRVYEANNEMTQDNQTKSGDDNGVH